MPLAAYAVIGDLMIGPNDVYLSNPAPVTSKSVRIYATVHNTGVKDALASVRFSNKLTGEQIGGDQPISLIAGRTDDVFVDWQPESGSYTILVQIIPWTPENDDPSNNTTSFVTFVDRDSDKDGVGNKTDIDDDNDGIADTADTFPTNPYESLDSDGDGKGNNADEDDDNDNTRDEDDAFPMDPLEQVDTDKDGIGNNSDEDDDNDGLKDVTEDENQNKIKDKGETDPLIPDSDGDKVADGKDAFPLNPNETTDFDQDTIGDNADTDDDNDHVEDTVDINPKNQGPMIEIEDSKRTVNVANTVVIDTSESVDLDGEIVNTVIVIEKISTTAERSALRSEAEQVSLPSQAAPTTKSSVTVVTTPAPSATTQTTQNDQVSTTVGSETAPSQHTTPSDQAINLSNVQDIIAMYFKNPDSMIPLENTENGERTLDFTTDPNAQYRYIGETFKGSFPEPGTYKITIIAQDNKNETRTEEVIIKVRDYQGLFKKTGLGLLLLLAISGAVKYIFRATELRRSEASDKRYGTKSRSKNK